MYFKLGIHRLNMILYCMWRQVQCISYFIDSESIIHKFHYTHLSIRQAAIKTWTTHFPFMNTTSSKWTFHMFKDNYCCIPVYYI